MRIPFPSLTAVCFLCWSTLALLPCGTAHAADTDSVTDKLGSILNKGKDRAAELLEKGGQLGKDILHEGKVLRDDAVRKGDELLNSLDKSLDSKSAETADAVYSRLAVRNQCAKTMTAAIAEFEKNPGHNAAEVPARSLQHIEVWQGTDAPHYTYTFRLKDDTTPPKSIPLATLLKSSEKTVTRRDKVEFHDYIWTICTGNAPLKATGHAEDKSTAGQNSNLGTDTPW